MLIPTLTLLTALGSALIASVFFAFSTFIMKAFNRLSPPEAIRAMQSVNIAVINPLFMDILRVWTMWNHVRTIAAIAGAVLLTIALCYSADS